MKPHEPALGIAGLVLLASALSGLARLTLLDDTLIGLQGGPLLHWTGPLASTDGWAVWVLVPLVLLGACLPVAVLLTRRAWGGLVFALGLIAALGWTGLVGLLGLGVVLDGWLHGPVLFLSYHHVTPWEAWGRWLGDGSVLVLLALLLGLGPEGPTARRAVFVGLLGLAADQALRIGVTVLSGSVPFLWDGLGPLSVVAPGLWVLLAGLAVGFVGLVSNLPGADGPPRRGLLFGLALAGFLLGLEAGLLYALGLLHAFGLEVHLELPMPLYRFLLGATRLGIVAVGLAAIGLGRWREVDTHTAV